MNTNQSKAERAVWRADDLGREDREQAAIAWLHECGEYNGLTNDEALDLDASVRLACVRIDPAAARIG